MVTVVVLDFANILLHDALDDRATLGCPVSVILRVVNVLAAQATEQQTQIGLGDDYFIAPHL